MEINIKVDMGEITRTLTNEVQRAAHPIAVRQAINKTLGGAFTQAKKEIAGELKVAQKNIAHSVKQHKASGVEWWQGSLVVSGSKKDLVPLAWSRDVRIYKSTKRKAGRITYKGKQMVGAFQLPNIKRAVFRKDPSGARYKSGNAKVQRLSHYTPAQQFTHAAQAKVAMTAPGRFLREFDAAFANQLRRRGLA